jgi:ribonuclease D
MAELPEHRWISDAQELPLVVAALERAPWVALDTESNSMFVYRERMCLLQLNCGGSLFVIDGLALATSAPSTALDSLKPQLERRDRPLYLHGGEYDVAVFRRDFGIQLAGVWDTQQAASLLGYDKTGYGAVVERSLGLVLDKAWTHYDWGTRPIAPGALQYALDDVIHLPRVGELLLAEIQQNDLVEELAIACQAVSEAAWSGGFDPAGFWKIKGVRELKGHQLGALCAMWSWRDQLARQANQPPGRLINNQLLFTVARIAPTNFQLLKKIGLRGYFLSEHGEGLIACIKKASSDPAELPTRPRAREVAEDEELRETRLKDWRRAEAERRQVPLQVVLPARALEYLKQHGMTGTDIPQLGAKRLRLYGDDLRRLCS